jgi:chemotaxis regulatin CheY-phosphate phosphatase CheZ
VIYVEPHAANRTRDDNPIIAAAYAVAAAADQLGYNAETEEQAIATVIARVLANMPEVDPMRVLEHLRQMH